MSKPLTSQQEHFAKLVAQGKSHSDAYRGAYKAEKMKPTSINEEASRLMANPAISSRVDEFRKEFAPINRLTLENHIEELNRLKELALEAGKFEAAITAEVNRGKASGLYVTKTEDVTDPMRKALGRMKPDKLDSVIEALDQVKSIREKAKSAS